MADVKVSALTALTGADLANGDQFLVTDVGSPNVSKSITADELAQGSQFSSRYVAKSGDYLFISAGAFGANGGSPSNDSLGGSAYSANSWLLDADSLEQVGVNVDLPTFWTTANVEVYWANAGAGSGDVVWGLQINSLTTGETIAFSPLIDTTVTATAGARNVITATTLATALSVTSGDMWFVNVYRKGADAADTLTNDAGMLAVRVVRAS